MSAFVEATDWIVWQLTGTLVRASCSAGYKACWSASDGLPPREYFEAAYPGFPDPHEKLGTSFASPGACAGTLRAEVAARLGLSHIGRSGCRQRRLVRLGARRRGAKSRRVPHGRGHVDLRPRHRPPRSPHAGITGVVEDGILPGFFGYEAGQAAVGDMFAWFGGRLLGLQERRVRTGSSWYEEFETEAAKLAPGASGLVALDWWNGNRTILGDADLSGVIAGLTLATTPAEVYRALLESVAFGTRRIIENFVATWRPNRRDRRLRGDSRAKLAHDAAACGCDGLEVTIPDSSQIPGPGGGLCAGIAAGARGAASTTLQTAVSALRPAMSRRYEPDPQHHATYDEVYSVFGSLHDELGRDHVEWLHHLKADTSGLIGE